MTQPDRLPPHNAAAERGVLGGILRDPGVLPDVAALLAPGDFYLDAHQRVYRAQLALAAEGAPIDLVTLDARLRLGGQSAGAGGRELLADLWTAAPTGANAEYHAGLVRECAAVRALIHASTEILRDAYDRTGPASELLARAERAVFAIAERQAGGRGDPVPASDLVREALARIDDRVAGNSPPGTLTGYCDLDDVLGDLRGGQMVVIGARPGGGKTSLAACVAANVAGAGVPALFFSMEMPGSQIGERLVAMGSGVPLNRVARGRDFSADDCGRLAGVTAPGGLGTVPVFVDDAGDQSGASLLSAARRAVRRLGVGLVVVDYLQLLRPENPQENRTQQVGLMARRVKQLARECDVPVLCLCQLNRQAEQRGADHRPRLSDLRESGEIEAHADAVVMLAPQPDQDQGAAVWLIDAVVAKNRNGPTGDVTLAYRRACTRFENAARNYRSGAA